MRQLTLVLVLGTVAAALLPTAAGAASSTEANPFLNEQASATPAADQGSNANYRSTITSVTPSVAGLQVQVLAFADRLQLFNHTGTAVTIYGYQGEPYARLLANGTVQLNEHSPALYLNASFYGGEAVPASANPASAPQWATVFHTSTLQWHDHRIHWASPDVPPVVTDKSKRTFVFAWSIPISVGTRHGFIRGQLYWVPNTSTASTGAYISLAIVAVIAILLVVVVRRRRQKGAGGSGGPDDAGPPAPKPATREAW